MSATPATRDGLGSSMSAVIPPLEAGLSGPPSNSDRCRVEEDRRKRRRELVDQDGLIMTKDVASPN